MPWIGKSVIIVRAKSLSTADKLFSWTTVSPQTLRSRVRARSGRSHVSHMSEPTVAPAVTAKTW